MKKTLLLFTLVIFISTTGFVNSPGTATSQVTIKSPLAHVPAAVQHSFDNVVTDIMNDEFPSNTGWDDSYPMITWTHDRGDWVANGKVFLTSGGGLINVINSRFRNNGRVISFNYTVVPIGV